MPVFTNHPWLNQDHDTLAKYNHIDVLATGRSYPKLLTEMQDQRMLKFYEERVWPLVEPVLDMQRRGLRLDGEARRNYRVSLRTELEQVDEDILDRDSTGALRKPVGKSKNGLGSTQRVASFLYDELKFKCYKRTPSLKPSVDQEALLKLLQGTRKMDLPKMGVVYDLFHRSRLRTIDQRYLDLETDSQERVHPRVKLGGTATGRFAYDDPPLQQYPPEARHIFAPAPGFVFVGADSCQLEARISAYLSEDHFDIQLFETGEDVHAHTARSLFGYTESEWNDLDPTTREGARNYAKAFRYGLVYGGNPETMKTKAFCPCPRCEQYLPPVLELPRYKVKEASQRFLAEHNGIERYRADVDKQVRDHKSLTNPFGRKRFFFQPWPGCKRAAWNWPIQSTAADIINAAMLRLWQRYRAPFFLQMHDYLGVEVPLEEAATWAQRIVEEMERPVPEMGGAIFPVEVKMESPWGVKQEATSLAV